MQTMALQLGGEVQPGIRREFGYAQVAVSESFRIIGGILKIIYR